jgi:hypothetical protein
MNTKEFVLGALLIVVLGGVVLFGVWSCQLTKEVEEQTKQKAIDDKPRKIWERERE